MKRFSKRFKSYGVWKYSRKLTSYAQRIIHLHKLYSQRSLKQLLITKIRKPNLSILKWSLLKPESKHQRILSLKVLSGVKEGKSLTVASREFSLNPEMVKKHIHSAIYKKKGRWVARLRDKIERQMNIYENGRIKSIVVTNSRDASIIGEYYNDVKKALATGDESLLKKYKKITIKDAKGKKHKLETNLDKIKEIEEAKEEPEFFEIYEE